MTITAKGWAIMYNTMHIVKEKLPRMLVTNGKADFIRATAVGERDFNLEMNLTPDTAKTPGNL